MKKLIVLIAAVALACSFSVPTFAADDWSLYGSARFQTFYSSRDEDLTGGDSDNDVAWYMDRVVTRVGLKANHGDVGGHVELRALGGSHVRIWNGWWDFGSGKLYIGQSWSVLSTLYSNQAYKDTGLGTMGDNSYRTDMIWLTFPFGLKLAFVNPNPKTGGITGDVDTTIPKVEFAYTMNGDVVSFDVGGGVNAFTIEDANGGTADYDILAYELQGGVRLKFGPAFLKTQLYVAQNFGNYGAWSEIIRNTAVANGDDVEDVTSYGLEFVAGAKLNDMVTLEGGLGYIASTYEMDSQDYDDDAYSWYFQAKLTLAPGVYVIPEVGQINYDEREDAGTTIDEGAETYFGAKWQINF